MAVFKFEQPPERLTWYHLPSLLSAEAGRLKYNLAWYPLRGVSNNAIVCCWAGLLVDGNGGMVLTDIGRTMLTDWKNSPAGQAWLAEEADGNEPDDNSQHDQAQDAARPQPVPASAEQLGLFGAAS